MVYFSPLNKKEILQVLQESTQPFDFSHLFSGNALLAKVSGNKFVLIKTGKMGRGGGQCAFYAKLVDQPSGTLIRGGFSVGSFGWSLVGIGLGIGLFANLFIIANVGFTPSVLIFAVGTILWMGFVVLLSQFGKLIWRNQQAEVLVFIETHLKGKRL